MITITTGDLLQAQVEAIVNAVNTHGTMSKGLALAFKKAYPQMFHDYHVAAQAGRVTLGKMWVWTNPTDTNPRLIINFPTKGHWRSRSRIEDIQSGLEDLRQVITDRAITSIALPALGCGLGGLDWEEVSPLIISALEDLPDIEVMLYSPQ
ncbi:MAG: macro domain-containing protein [Actinomycetaceae bacterium]|nr:macro domain-containing protein [Actinomycetaceae bacterium]